MITERKSSSTQTISDAYYRENYAINSTVTNLYLDIPVMYRHQLTKDLTLFGGGYLGLLMYSDIQMEIANEFNGGRAVAYRLPNTFNTLTAGITVGGAYTISKWTLTATYFTDVTDVTKDNNSDVKFKGFTASLGYAL